MKTNKIGTLFLISVLALAGIGISYAGFTDTLAVYGTVNTATVQWNVEHYSSTVVYKVWAMDPNDHEAAPTGEIYRWHGFGAAPTVADIENQFPNCYAMVVATATAGPGTIHDGTQYDVDLAWNNIFPCQDFTVDIVIHYTGSIPAKINSANIMEVNGPGWLTQLWNTVDPNSGPAVTYGAFFCDANGNLPAVPVPVTLGTQIHNGDYIYAFMTIHIPQDNYWQGLTGTFHASVGIIQWNEGPQQITI